MTVGCGVDERFFLAGELGCVKRLRYRMTVKCGVDERFFLDGEFGCVKRLRYRRLLAFLWCQGYDSTFRALLEQTTAYFCSEYLESLVFEGEWKVALDYVYPRFLPPDTCSPISVEAHVLYNFLHTHCEIDKDKAASVDWERLLPKAAEIVQDLVDKTPELNSKPLLLLPHRQEVGPHHVLPIGFSFAPFRRRRHVKKKYYDRRPKSCAIAKLYLDKKRSLPSSGHCSQVLSVSETKAKAWKWLVDLLGQCQEVGKCPDLYRQRLLQASNVKQQGPSSSVQPSN